MSCGADRGPLGGQRARGELARRGRWRAAKKPMRTSALVIFCHAAVVVTIASQASGTSVTSA